MAEDISRSTTGVYLPTELAQEVLGEVVGESVIMQSVQRARIAAGGSTFHVVTREPEAQWVGETDLSPVDRHEVANKTARPYKLSVTETFSNEFERDLPGLFAELKSRLPASLGKKFDSTVCGFATAPGDKIDTFAEVDTQVVTAGENNAAYKGLTSAMKTVAAAGGDIDTWLLSPAGEINFLDQLDSNDRPVFISNPQADGSVGSMLARRVFKSKRVGHPGESPSTPQTFGFGGDFSGARWGMVEAIKVQRLTEATLVDGTVEVEVDDGEGGTAGTVTIPRLIHLAQQEMFALKVTVEVGFRIDSTDKVVRLIGPIPD